MGPNPMYPEEVFRSRFRVARALFIKIHTELFSYDTTVWKTSYDGLGREGIKPHVKVLEGLRIWKLDDS